MSSQDTVRQENWTRFRFAQACFHCHLAAQRRSEKRREANTFYQRRYTFMPAHQLASQPHLTLLDQRNLSLGLEGLGEAAHVVGEGTLGAEELDVGTVDADLSRLALGDVLLAAEGSEAPVLGDDDLLATGELVLGATESLNDVGADCMFLLVICVGWQMRKRRDLRESRVRQDRMIWPMLTRATRPLGLPNAPRIPVCSLSAPAQDNILLIRTTWKG